LWLVAGILLAIGIFLPNAEDAKKANGFTYAKRAAIVAGIAILLYCLVPWVTGNFSSSHAGPTSVTSPGLSLPIYSPSVSYEARTDTWSAVVPGQIVQGVKLELPSGQKLELRSGDTLEITASDLVDIGRGPIGPYGEVGYRDTSVDSPYSDHVGGLEMWIGTSSNRYFIGPHFLQQVGNSGVPTLRVIESLHGYGDGNSGAFRVTVRVTSRRS
jgi:hypothetical protein